MPFLVIHISIQQLFENSWASQAKHEKEQPKIGLTHPVKLKNQLSHISAIDSLP